MAHKRYDYEQVTVELESLVSIFICFGLHGSILSIKRYTTAFSEFPFLDGVDRRGNRQHVYHLP